MTNPTIVCISVIEQRRLHAAKRHLAKAISTLGSSNISTVLNVEINTLDGVMMKLHAMLPNNVKNSKNVKEQGTGGGN